MRHRYKICFEFFGLNFFGSQKQPDKRTVQDEIEKALCTLTKNKICTIFSGRTDAKVSASSQTAHFDLDDEQFKIKDINRFLYSINSILPSDIKIFSLEEVDLNFHAQKDAKFKHYRYTILNHHVASVFSDLYLFYPYHKLDISRMNKALSFLVGYHDFSSFKSQSDNPYDDCMIYFAKAKEEIIENRNFIFIDIIGDRFLYNMIRTIAGQLIFIERNNLSPELMKEVLEAKNRAKAADKQIAKALTLKYVGYEDVNSYIQKITQKEGK